MAIKEKPTNFAMLNQNGFALTFRRLPFTTFYCQRASIPSLGLEPIMMGTPFVKLNYSSTEVNVGRFTITFKVDENLKNYSELFNWIKGLGFPESFDQARDNRSNNTYDAMRSDASLIITTSTKVPNIDIQLIDCVPTGLSGLTFSTTDQANVEYVTAVAEFTVRDFKIADLDECESI